jgi:predicted nucleic acid-binding protein
VIVVDASAMVEWLLRGPRAAEIERRIFDVEAEAHAPHLIDIEVAHVLRRLQRLGEMTARRGREALQDLADAPLRRVSHQPLLPRIWDLRANFSAYDASYVTLAEALDGALVTLDAKLAKAAATFVRVSAPL